ncbi:MAG: FtsX-like permease family protein [Acidobacteriota bacterium]
MKYLHLVWRNLTRKKVRTGLTVLSIFVAFFLYGLLTAIKVAFGAGIEINGLERLVMLNKVSIIQPLPLAYRYRIEGQDGVAKVSQASWFGGIYQDPKNQMSQFAVDPEAYLAIYPEFILPEERRQAWFDNRGGAIVGRATAKRFDWQVGDRVTFEGTIYRPPDDPYWEFVIEGIYEGADSTADDSLFLFHYDYLEERMGMLGAVGMYIIEVAEPDRAAAIAENLDKLFANSSAETKTSTEKAFVQAFANQTGNIGAIVTGVAAVVFFTLLLVAGSAMAQSVRERIHEIGVLKTLGFGDGKVMALVLLESSLLALLGGGAGLGLIYYLSRNFDLGGAFLPTLYMPNNALVLGIAMVLGLGLITGAAPALQALRLKVVDALRRA